MQDRPGAGLRFKCPLDLAVSVGLRLGLFKDMGADRVELGAEDYAMILITPTRTGIPTRYSFLTGL